MYLLLYWEKIFSDLKSIKEVRSQDVYVKILSVCESYTAYATE